MQDSAAPGWEEVYPRNKAFRARIIYVDPASKAVRLSFRPHVVAWAPAALPPIGSLMKVSLSLMLPDKRVSGGMGVGRDDELAVSSGATRRPAGSHL